MTEDEARFYQALMQNLHNAVSGRRVALEGLEQESAMLEIYRSKHASLLEIKRAARREYQLLSIQDLRRLKAEMDGVRGAIRQSSEIVSRLETLVKDHDIEIRHLGERIDYFVIKTRRGVVLDFKGRTSG